MKKHIGFLIIITFLAIPTVYSQNYFLIDSMRKKLSAYEKNISIKDTSKAILIFEISKMYWGNNPDTAIYYAIQSLHFSEKLGYKRGVGNAYKSLGVAADDKGNYREALDNYFNSLKIMKSINDKKGISAAYNNIGIVYRELGNLTEALKFYQSAAKVFKEIGDNIHLTYTYNNIGNIYIAQTKYDEALKTFLTALETQEKLNDITAISSSYNNIGLVYKKKNQFAEAISFYSKALKIFIETGDKTKTSTAYSNLGSVYFYQGNYTKSLEYHLLSVSIREMMGEKNGIASSYYSLGEIYYKLNKYPEALAYEKKALQLAKELGAKDRLAEAYGGLAEVNAKLKNYEEAYNNYVMYKNYSDTLFNVENQKKLTQLDMKFEFEKTQDSAKAEQMKKDIKTNAEIDKQKTARNGFIGGFILVILLIVLLYNRYRLKQKSNAALSKTLQELKSTQEQLVLSEKQAMLGVVATRMAHEIQNPLNFVNNFSELSADIVDEILTAKNDEERKEAAEILTDNLNKIHHHGKRAETILKQLQAHTTAGTAIEFFEEEA